MRRFLEQYWLWILIPFAVVLAVVGVLLLVAGGDGSSDFVYGILD